MIKKIFSGITLLILILIILFMLIIPFFYLRYIKRMENTKCQCSRTFSRHFITFYSVYIYISLIVTIILSAYIPYHKLIQHKDSETKLIIGAGFSFLIAYYLYRYSRNIIENTCKCAESWEVEVMKYHSYLQFILVFISCINIIIILSK